MVVVGESRREREAKPIPAAPGRQVALNRDRLLSWSQRVRQAKAMFDQMLEDAKGELSIRDMDGKTIDPDRLRALTDEEQAGPT